MEYPEGTAINKTNLTAKKIEKEVFKVIERPKFSDGKVNFLVESNISQVGEGAGNPETDNGNTNEMPNKAKITLSMKEYKFRNGISSEELRMEIQKQLIGKFPCNFS